MASEWNHKLEYKKNKKKKKDSFWWGFIPSVTLPLIINIIIFKLKWTTEVDMFEAMYKLANKGLIGRDLLTAIIPSILLIIVFSSLSKEKASIGSFVGLCPWLVITFIYY